jgi:hypothetical protein
VLAYRELRACFSTVDNMNLLIWSNPIHYKKSIQYCTKFWKKFTILEQIFILVIAKYRRSKVALSIINQTYSSCYDLFEMSECSHEQPMTTCAFTHTSLERLYLLLYDNE